MKIKEFIIAFVATLICSILGKYLSLLPGLKLIGHLVIALIIGIIFQVNKKIIYESKSEISFISNKFLRLGIILLGFKLNIDALLKEGISTILLAIFIVTFTITIIYLLAKFFKVNHTLALLSACGCAICGAAAVMGISHPAKAKEEETILSIAVVCVLGTVFTLIIVFFKPFLNLNDFQYGILAGGSLHEIAHAVAAGSSGSSLSLDIAIITKLSRVLLLAPVAIIVGYIEHKRNNNFSHEKIPIPYFMLGFILTSIIGTYFNISNFILNSFVNIAYLSLGMAMAALGMNVNFKIIKEKGKNIFIASSIGSLILLVTVYSIAKIFF